MWCVWIWFFGMQNFVLMLWMVPKPKVANSIKATRQDNIQGASQNDMPIRNDFSVGEVDIDNVVRKNGMRTAA